MRDWWGEEKAVDWTCFPVWQESNKYNEMAQESMDWTRARVWVALIWEWFLWWKKRKRNKTNSHRLNKWQWGCPCWTQNLLAQEQQQCLRDRDHTWTDPHERIIDHMPMVRMEWPSKSEGLLEGALAQGWWDKGTRTTWEKETVTTQEGGKLWGRNSKAKIKLQEMIGLLLFLPFSWSRVPPNF